MPFKTSAAWAVLSCALFSTPAVWADRVSGYAEWAGAYSESMVSTQLQDSTGAPYSAQPVLMFCLDVLTVLPGDGVITYESGAGARTLVGGSGEHGVAAVHWLFDNFYAQYHLNGNDQQQWAFQYALWEIGNDFNGTLASIDTDVGDSRPSTDGYFSTQPDFTAAYTAMYNGMKATLPSLASTYRSSTLTLDFFERTDPTQQHLLALVEPAYIPVVADDTNLVTRVNQPLDLPDLLTNDPNIPTFSVATPQASTLEGGSVAPTGNPDEWRYTPPTGFIGQDSFTYEVCLQTACRTATVTINVVAPELRIDLGGLPLTGTQGQPYTGSFTCTNAGTADAVAGTSCAVGNLPAGLTQGACTISPGNVSWVAGNAIPMGSTVSCAVGGTPESSQANTVVTGTAASTDNNPASTAGTASIAMTVLGLPQVLMDVSGMPLQGVVGQTYSGVFTCRNTGTVADAAAPCSVVPAPWMSAVTCTVGSAGAVWSSPGAIGAGETVTCRVGGEPDTVGSWPLLAMGGSGTTPVALQVVVTALVPELRIDLGGLPLTGTQGQPYTGSFTCTNAGTADAVAGTSCAVGNLPAGLTQGACTISPGNVPWVAGNAIPMGSTVSCAVGGTPESSQANAVVTGTATSTDNNPASTAGTASIAMTVLGLPQVLMDVSGMPLQGVVGKTYSGVFTCRNTGTVADTAAPCSVVPAPWMSAVTCTVGSAGAVWSSPGAIGAGETVTCRVGGEPDTVGSWPLLATGGSGTTPIALQIAVTDDGSGLPVPAPAPVAVPSLTAWAQLLLMGVLAGFGGWRVRQRRSSLS